MLWTRKKSTKNEQLSESEASVSSLWEKIVFENVNRGQNDQGPRPKSKSTQQWSKHMLDKQDLTRARRGRVELGLALTLLNANWGPLFAGGRWGGVWLFQTCGNRIYFWSLGNQMHWIAKYPLNLLLNQLKLCKYSTNFSNMSANYSKMCFFANFPKVNNNKIWYLFLCRMTNRATRFICPLKLI